MVGLTDSQCLDAGENGENVSLVIEVETPSRYAWETHQKNSDINDNETTEKGDELSNPQRLDSFKNGDKILLWYGNCHKGIKVFLFRINPVNILMLKCADC